MRRRAIWIFSSNSNHWDRVSGPMPISACCTGWKICSAGRATGSRFRPFAIRGFAAPWTGNGRYSMPHDPRTLLEDIGLAAARVQEFTAGATAEGYAQSSDEGRKAIPLLRIRLFATRETR